MISYVELHDFASDRLSSSTRLNEAELRRSVSTLYYGLFHRAAAATVAAAFSLGGATFTRLAVRSVDHKNIRNTCKSYVSRSKGGLKEGALASIFREKPDLRLITVADAFISLDEARQRADYDLQSTFSRQEALDHLATAEIAHRRLDELDGTTTLTVFLLAVLMDGRWPKHG